jgi:hypothetical protein
MQAHLANYRQRKSHTGPRGAGQIRLVPLIKRLHFPVLCIVFASFSLSCSRKSVNATLPEELAWEAVSTNVGAATLRVRLVECVVKRGKQWRLEMHRSDSVKISVYDGQHYFSTDQDGDENPLKTLEFLYARIGEADYKGIEEIDGFHSAHYVFNDSKWEAQLFIEIKSSFPVRIRLKNKKDGLTIETDFYPLQEIPSPASELFDGKNLIPLLKPSRIL